VAVHNTNNLISYQTFNEVSTQNKIKIYILWLSTMSITHNSDQTVYVSSKHIRHCYNPLVYCRQLLYAYSTWIHCICIVAPNTVVINNLSLSLGKITPYDRKLMQF